TAAHCGVCSRACSSAGASTTSCAGGECDPTCSSGFRDRRADYANGPDDGCEPNLDTTTASCGACGRACSNANASAMSCSGGECDPTCNSGFGDCAADDGNGPDDGCETNLSTAAANCGTCGRACSSTGASATS